MAEIEDRIILTKRIDRSIFQKHDVVYITEKKVEEQIKEVYWFLNVQQGGNKTDAVPTVDKFYNKNSGLFNIF